MSTCRAVVRLVRPRGTLMLKKTWPRKRTERKAAGSWECEALLKDPGKSQVSLGDKSAKERHRGQCERHSVLELSSV